MTEPLDDIDSTVQTIEIDGVLRPTRNSRGQLIHTTQSGITNFWRWFGDSFVVDAEGRPLVVYHGTPLKSSTNKAPFDVFDKGNWGGGIFFSKSYDWARNYATNRAAAKEWDYDYVFRSYLRVVNPVDVTSDAGIAAILDALGDSIATYNYYAGDMGEIVSRDQAEEMLRGRHPWLVIEPNIAQLRGAGFDGSVMREGGELTFAAFNHLQIKSAADNSGSFDPDNPSLTDSDDALVPALNANHEESPSPC